MRLLFSTTLLAMLLVACSSPKTAYYTLDAQPIQPVATGTKEMRVMVGPVTLPSMLDQPQIVIQGNGNEVQIHEYHRWAGSLKSDVGRVIAANLARDLGATNVWNFAQSTQTNFDYQVFIDVQNLQSKPDDSVLVDVLWTIKPSASKGKSDDKNAKMDAGIKTKPFMGRSLVREPITGSGVDSIVAAQSRAFAKVSQEIAQAIR